MHDDGKRRLHTTGEICILHSALTRHLLRHLQFEQVPKYKEAFSECMVNLANLNLESSNRLRVPRQLSESL